VRVYPSEGVEGNIGVSIQPTLEPNRVTFFVSSKTWVIVPEVVVVKPGLRVVPLPG
jgi:hypothetical protein